MIDRQRAEAAFLAYTAGYDPGSSMIRHKIDHTLRVAGNCERIAAGTGMGVDAAGLAWFLGLLHDIGRFEQARRYGTFVDSVSVDHAEFGADLLFREGLIRQFPAEVLPAEDLSMLETAVRLHNKLVLPEGLDERTRRFCDIIRDADKADIFRVVAEIPFEERAGASKGLLREEKGASEAVMDCVLQHRCVPRDARKTRFDVHVSHCCLVFELVFPESRKIVREQGFLDRLLAETDGNGEPLWSERELEQLRTVRRETDAFLEQKEDMNG